VEHDLVAIAIRYNESHGRTIDGCLDPRGPRGDTGGEATGEYISSIFGA